MRCSNTSSLVSVAAALPRVVALITIFITTCFNGVVESCGPGRGAGGFRKHGTQQATPFVFKQHVPNVWENNLAASGLSEGKIDRGSERFKDLVPIYDKDIIFRDDEGTGADRFMTKRCRERLITLNIIVMNHWPGVKLRVTEGWAENKEGFESELHYEGRAVDITTSDRNRSKYGMLARMAVEAGFDWVYYESKSHIHCSVKSDSQNNAKYGGCFTAETTVQTSTGEQRKLSELKIGEHILALDQTTNTLVYSEVMLFLDWNPNQTHQFLHFVLASGRTLTVTPAHLLVTIDPETNATQSVYADRLHVNSTMLVMADDNSQLVQDWVVSIDLVLRKGIYAPLTSAGTVVVDGVVASCYATVDSVTLAHWMFAPVRFVMNMKHGLSRFWTLLQRPIESWEGHTSSSRNDLVVYQTPSVGVYWYARVLHSIGQYVIPYKMHSV